MLIKIFFKNTKSKTLLDKEDIKKVLKSD